MKITRELVERIAGLSRLSLSEEEKKQMTVQLEEILGSMAALDRLTLDGEHALQERENVLRPDEETQSMERTELLKNAPETDGEYIIVPAALGQEEEG
ncbi:MAG: Asp-tRNA(Asn)/Glu-tRNA(Gln) amidotransferase subunit GatC [Ruminococcaceae bacterium]|nr:Asp-tRNA(Asn)/Glu-tRNA(Gln) amidotransferase subunit GatC [Oscillospiraceae bacterium]